MARWKNDRVKDTDNVLARDRHAVVCVLDSFSTQGGGCSVCKQRKGDSWTEGRWRVGADEDRTLAVPSIWRKWCPLSPWAALEQPGVSVVSRVPNPRLASFWKVQL